MTTKDDKSQEPGTRAPNSVVPESKRSSDVQPPKAKHDFKGAPEGYKPDTSVQYKAGKDGADSVVTKEDGKTVETAVSPYNAAQPVPEELDKDHTYRDRVEAQARALGIEIDPDWTLEYLLWVIRMKGSS